LTDFGLAKMLGRDSGLTQSNAIMGTPNYLAPEVAAGKAKEVTTAADVLSLGAILYELLTGRPPFQAETVVATLQNGLHTEPPSPRSVNSSVPRDLDIIALKCLAKEPARRYRTALELAEDLEHFQRHEPIAARPVSTSGRVWRWCRRKPALAGSLAALWVVFTAGFAGLLWQWRRAVDLNDELCLERQRAELNAASEAQQRKLAEANAAQSQERLVRLHVANGTRLLEDGDSLAALGWFARALDLVRDEPEKALVHRLRLQSVLHHCPKLLQMWFHTGAVNSAVFSPDGALVATANWADTAHLWDAATRQEVCPPLSHGGMTDHVAFSPDGQWLVSVGRGGAIKVWDTKTGKLFCSTTGIESLVMGSVFSRDGRRLMTRQFDGRVRIWSAQQGELSAPALRHGWWATAAQFHPDERRVLTA
jgi:hypothetical protein